jgi:hypothetical protein
MRPLLAALVALGLFTSPLRAQGSPTLVKYGKWVLAAGALGMNYLAARAHDRAEDRFDRLEDRCRGDQRTLCDVGPSGDYIDPRSEFLYQESLRYDRQARRLLFGGETALLGAAAMFVWELTRHTPKPDNIPFEPEVRSLRRATGVGIRVSF